MADPIFSKSFINSTYFCLSNLKSPCLCVGKIPNAEVYGVDVGGVSEIGCCGSVLKL